MVSFLVYAIYVHRLMHFGLPAPNLLPGMFIAVGPPAFTGLAPIGMSNTLPEGYGYFATHPVAIDVLPITAVFIAIFLWALAFWFFCIALVSVLAGIKDMAFHLVWWAFVFPSVSFTIITINIGKQLGSQGILWVSSAMTILLVAVWLFVFIAHARAVLMKQMMIPNKDEDEGDHISSL